jgi:hypothetical protein
MGSVFEKTCQKIYSKLDLCKQAITDLEIIHKNSANPKQLILTTEPLKECYGICSIAECDCTETTKSENLYL